MHIKTIDKEKGDDILVGWCSRPRRQMHWSKRVIDRPGGLLAVRNSGVIAYGGTTQEIRSGEMVLYDALPRHHFSAVNEWDFCYFHVPEEMVGKARELPYNTPVPGVRLARFSPSELARIKLEIQEAYSLSLLRRPGWEELVHPLLQLVLARFFQALPREGIPREESRLRIAARKLETLAFPQNITELARSCGMSKTDFFRKFRKEYGCSPVEYRDNLIIARAKTLLCSTGMRIREIADELNFQDPYYFTKFFHARTGTAPTHYRKKRGLGT